MFYTLWRDVSFLDLLQPRRARVEEQRREAALLATKETVTAAEAAKTEAETKRDAAKADLEAEVAKMQVQLKRASEDRELENKIFQQPVADQQATAALHLFDHRGIESNSGVEQEVAVVH